MSLCTGFCLTNRDLGHRLRETRWNIGSFEVTGGTIVPSSYKRNPAHLLISQDGIFRLQDELHDRVLQAVDQGTVSGYHTTA